MTSLMEQLGGIEASLDAGEYRVGTWQRFVSAAGRLPEPDRSAMSEDVSRVSRKLHRRRGFMEVPFGVGVVAELVLLVIGGALLQSDSVVLLVLGLGALALSLQPSIKVAVGLALGIRYDYVYLWYFEPRFKMRYGTYLRLPPAARVGFHLAGSVGTVLAMFLGYLAFLPVNTLMAWACFVFFLGALAMQVGAFVAEWAGVRKVAGFRLSTLTSPATAAAELRELMSSANA